MRQLLPLAAALALAACGTLASPSAPACHGARRPANPNGSVLVATPAPPASTPSPSGPSAGGQCAGAAR